MSIIRAFVFADSFETVIRHCGFFWDCRTKVFCATLTHKCAQAYLYTYLWNEVGGQTCVVECQSEWRSTSRTLIFFSTLLRPIFGLSSCDLDFFFIGYTCIFVVFVFCAQIVTFYYPLCLWNAVSCMLQVSHFYSAVVCVHCGHMTAFSDRSSSPRSDHQGYYTFSISKFHTFPDSNFQTSQ